MMTKEVLPNGLTLLTEEMPHVRSVAVGVWLKRGSRHERPAQSGICHFIEHMVFKGTRSRSAEQIAAQVDSIGGHMDAFTSKEYAAFHLKVLDEHLPLAVELLSDIVLHPAFDPREMAKEKRVIFEEMAMVEDTPDDLVMEMLTAACWPRHPLGRPILGTRRTVGGFTQKELLAFFRHAYRPSNLVVAAAGRLRPEEFRALADRYFGALEDLASLASAGPPRSVFPAVTRSKKELEQVHLALAVRGFAQADEDRYAGHVLNTVLGGSLSSRLFQNVREKRGLVYSISSGVATYSDAGMLTVYAGTGVEKLDEVIRLSVEEMRRLRDEPLGAEELRRARDHLKGGIVLSLESTASRMSHLARQEIAFGRQLSFEEIMEGIEAVTPEAVQRMGARMFTGTLALSVLGRLGRWRPRPSALRL